jgi:hypothetical protein
MRNRALRLALTFAVLAFPLAFVACSGDDKPVDDKPVAETVSVTAVTLDEDTMSLTAGGAAGALTATVRPVDATDKGVTWGSSNTAVATVSGSGANATVTPLSVGTATITVTTDDGGKTATCAVDVAAAAPKIYVAVGPQGDAGLYVDGVKDAKIGSQNLVDVFVDDAGTVHAAGWYNGLGAHYVNGEPTTVGDGAYGMLVTGGDVYVAGYELWPNISTAARLWRNGDSVTLEGAEDARSVMHGVTLDKDGRVYAYGWSYPNNGSYRCPAIWKEGAKHLNEALSYFLIMDMTVADDGTMTATLMCQYPDDFGISEYTAWDVLDGMTRWHRVQTADNDNFVRLLRDGQDIYLVGYNGAKTENPDYYPCYWKKDGSSWSKVALPRRAGADWAQAREMYVHPDGAVYVFGMSKTSGGYQPEVWVDGALIDDERRVPSMSQDPDKFCGIFAK